MATVCPPGHTTATGATVVVVVTVEEVVVETEVVVEPDDAALAILPGDPIAWTGIGVGVAAGASTENWAPLVPTVLNVVRVGLVIPLPLNPAALSNVAKGIEAGLAPKFTPVITVPALSKMFTESPAVLRPAPEPV